MAFEPVKHGKSQRKRWSLGSRKGTFWNVQGKVLKIRMLPAWQKSMPYRRTNINERKTNRKSAAT